jgi:hypothetical protein
MTTGLATETEAARTPAIGRPNREDQVPLVADCGSFANWRYRPTAASRDSQNPPFRLRPADVCEAPANRPPPSRQPLRFCQVICQSNPITPPERGFGLPGSLNRVVCSVVLEE